MKPFAQWVVVVSTVLALGACSKPAAQDSGGADAGGVPTPVVEGPAPAAEATPSEAAAARPAAAQPPGTTLRSLMKVPVLHPADKLAEHPERYYGQVVAVVGVVKELIGTNGLVLDQEGPDLAPDIFVLVPQTHAGISPGDKAEVVGVPWPFVVADLERKFSFLKPGWDREIDIKIKETPLIIGTSVVVDNEELTEYDLP